MRSGVIGVFRMSCEVEKRLEATLVVLVYKVGVERVAFISATELHSALLHSSVVQYHTIPYNNDIDSSASCHTGKKRGTIL